MSVLSDEQLLESYWEGYYKEGRSHTDGLRAVADAVIEVAQNAPVGEGCYVQRVPDHCDRIVWKSRYFHLPTSFEKSVEQIDDPGFNTGDQELDRLLSSVWCIALQGGNMDSAIIFMEDLERIKSRLAASQGNKE